MKMPVSPAVAKLRDYYLQRKSRNPSYSLRAFARDLQVSHSLLSLILRGKRPLTLKQAVQMGVAMNMGSEEQNQLIEQVTKTSVQKPGAGSLPAFWNFEIEQFRTISQWHHLAILDLVQTKGFKEDSHWIAKRLGISPIEVSDALERLERLELLTRDGEKLVKRKKFITFDSPTPKAAIRQYHLGVLSKVADILKKDTSQDELDHRWIGGGTIAVRKAQIKRAREKLKKFQEEFIREFGSGKEQADDVYQVSVHFFPVTQKEIKPKGGAYEK